MIRLAILIQVHKSPEQVARLCGRLRSESVDLYIHVDAKSDESPFRALIPDAHFVEDRVSVKWGHISSGVGVLFKLIKMALPRNYDYMAFISGQDYPIISIEDILKQLSDAPKREYIEIQEMNPVSDADRIKRVTCYHHCFKDAEYTKKYWNISHKYRILNRKYPFAERLYYGSCWWVFTSECVAEILAYHNRTPKYYKYYKYCFCADEFFVHNIIANSKFADRIALQKHYIDWSDKQAANPKLLTVDDFEAMRSSGMWFARKFDTEVDAEILDMLDNNGLKE